jgi:hypothetical protein
MLMCSALALGYESWCSRCLQVAADYVTGMIELDLDRLRGSNYLETYRGVQVLNQTLVRQKNRRARCLTRRIAFGIRGCAERVHRS